MRVDTSEYEQTHMKSPKGLGTWIFGAGRQGAWTDIWVQGPVSYSEAKRQAIRQAKDLGCDQISVQP